MTSLISLDTVVNVVGIVLGIVIPLIGSMIWLARKLDRIETNTEPIKAINETMIRLDERTAALTGKSGTVAVMLKNLGKVSVSATPVNVQFTNYALHFEKPIKAQAIDNIKRKTGFDEKEKQMFGKTARLVPVSPIYLIVMVPSSDPNLCSNYISMFLKWLDSDYLSQLEKSLADYERISV